jgi:hypothetical protein
VFTARYTLSPYIKRTRSAFKRLRKSIIHCPSSLSRFIDAGGSNGWGREMLAEFLVRKSEGKTTWNLSA